MSMRPAAFAIPGDIETKTGGYIYERQLLLALREAGREVRHIELPASFPNASQSETAQAIAQMRELPAGMPLILDGLVYGSIDTAGLAQVKAPLCAMIHHPLALETGLDAARARELARIERDNLALARHVVVPSRHTLEILTSQYDVPAEKISIAPPGFARAGPSQVKADPPLILSVGILAARKGHDVLLDALSRLRDLNWTCSIVGGTHDSSVKAALLEQRDALGLGDRVRFAGLIPEAELHALYGTASVFALATRYEGYGMVFSEAAANGLPIVTCAVGAVPDTVPEGAGLLVPPDDPEAFADALRQVLTNTVLRETMAEASTKAGNQLPTWADTASIMGRALDRIAG
ncbi:glycosyltransferase family 1 protein [Mesorhizobium sp. CAU 1732]|uniref:glycosyltransferase family 4 protein n=1 Tax=Mesorhizobium sp. CAU 1732 TaxID=3140358 RepID=UPI0032607DD7